MARQKVYGGKVPADEARRIDRARARRGVSKSEAVREALKEWARKNER